MGLLPQDAPVGDTITYSTDVLHPDGSREFFSMTIRPPGQPSDEPSALVQTLGELVGLRVAQWQQARQIVRTLLEVGTAEISAPLSPDEVRLPFPKRVKGMTIGHVLDTLKDVETIEWLAYRANDVKEELRDACHAALAKRGLAQAQERTERAGASYQRPVATDAHYPV
jgi:hypothetical protein